MSEALIKAGRLELESYDGSRPIVDIKVPASFWSEVIRITGSSGVPIFRILQGGMILNYEGLSLATEFTVSHAVDQLKAEFAVEQSRLTDRVRQLEDKLAALSPKSPELGPCRPFLLDEP